MTCPELLQEGAGTRSQVSRLVTQALLSLAAITIMAGVPVLFLGIDAKLFVSGSFPVFCSTFATLSPEQVASPSRRHARCSWYSLSTLQRAAEDVKETQVLLGLLEETHFHNKRL